MHMQITFTRSAALNDVATPAKPQAAARIKRIAKRHSQATGCCLARVSYSVGDDDESGHV